MKTIIDEHLWHVGGRGLNHETDAAIYLTASREDRMSNPLDPVRAAFDKAVGPHRKRQVLIDELKEPDVGKERRAQCYFSHSMDRNGEIFS